MEQQLDPGSDQFNHYLHFLMKELSVKGKRDKFKENSFKFLRKAFWRVWLVKRVEYSLK